MNTKTIAIIFLGGIIILTGAIFWYLKKDNAKMVKSDDVKTSEAVKTNIPKEYKASLTLNDNGMAPVQVDVLKDKTIIIKNDTPEEMTISLQGVIKIDKILVPAGKSVGSPVFGKTGELSVINLKNNKKIGTIVVW
jgi:hypothetical protein